MGNLETKVKPWQMDKSKTYVIKNYSAKIISDEGSDWGIEFYDYDGSRVEAEVSKDKLKDLPYEQILGTDFWIIAYKIEGQERASLGFWPLAHYWHESWRNK